MKALVLRSPEQLEIVNVPMPVLSAGEALIKVSQCGICGSDVRYFYGENPWAKQTLGRHVDNPPNIIPGHEFTGTVQEVFDRKDSHLLGKRVGVNTFTTCGRCHYCRGGQENLCSSTRHLGHGQGWGVMDFYPGGMAEFCPASVNQLYELHPDMSDEQATFLDPLIASLHAVDVGVPRPLDLVAIQGAGPIGLLIAQIVKVYGASRTFITDIAAENIEIARQVGVDFPLCLTPGQTSNSNHVSEALLNTIMKQTDSRGVDLVFNTVGTSESILESLNILKKGGTLVLMVTKDDEISFPSLLLSGERTIRTSSNALYTDFPRAIELISSGLVQVDPLITHHFNLSHGVEAFDAACHKERSGAVKVIIDCDPSGIQTGDKKKSYGS